MTTKFIITFCLAIASGPNVSWAATGATNESTGTATPITTSINPGAQKGKSSQSSGSAMNMAAAAMLMAACMATQPPNMALCMMGAMAAMQGGADKDAADQSGATQNATNTSGSTATNATPTYATAAAGTAEFDQQKKIKAGLATLKTAGYTASPAGISSSSGMVPASAFGSSGSMLSAGLDAGAVKEAEKIGKEVASKYGSMSMAADSSGGSGGGASEQNSDSSNGADGAAALAALKNPFALGSAQKAEMMAGKTVQFDGEPIGVRGNDIFEMVHAAYDRKRAGKHFIESDHDPDAKGVSVRAPASVINPASLSLPKR